MSIEKEFDHQMFSIYQRAKAEAGYTASAFFQMLERRGGLGTARYLINTPKPSDGYTALYLRSRLDLTVEAVVWDHPEYHSLFTEDEMSRIKKRLRDYKYPGVAK